MVTGDMNPFNLRTASEQKAYWQHVNEVRGEYRDTYERLTRTVLGNQTKLVLAEINGREPRHVIEIANRVIDETKIDVDMLYERLYLDVALRFAEDAYDNPPVKVATDKRGDLVRIPPDVKALKDVIDDWVRVILDYIRTGAVASMIQKVQESTKERVRIIVARGIEEGLSTDKLAEIIRREWFDPVSGVNQIRAQRIARTETIRASNFGSIEGVRTLSRQLDKPPLKFWISTYDNRVRKPPDDQTNHDTRIWPEELTKPIPLDQHFTLPNGDQLMMPGDPDAPADQTINCRCTVGYKTQDL